MLQVIYIPGLGDRRAILQRFAVKLWRLYGVMPHVFQMHWDNSTPYSDKQLRLLARVDTLHDRGPVVLVGSSAGASAVINAYEARKDKVIAVVCIAGKLNNPQTMASRYKQQTPSFWDSAHRVPAALKTLTTNDRKCVLSIRGASDAIVPARDSIIEGATNSVVWTRGHVLTIAWQLVFGARAFLRFAKQQIQQ